MGGKKISVQAFFESEFHINQILCCIFGNIDSLHNATRVL